MPETMEAGTPVPPPLTQAEIDQRVFDLYDDALAVALGAEVRAAVPFYGAAPETAGVPAIRAPLLIHHAEKDERINAMLPGYEAALKANGIPYEAHVYPGTQHGFHNNSTPRYDEAAAKLAWELTLAHFRQNLA